MSNTTKTFALILASLFAAGSAEAQNTTEPTAVDTEVSAPSSTAAAWRIFPTYSQARRFANYVICNGGQVINICFDGWRGGWVVTYF